MAITSEQHIRKLPAWGDGLYAHDPFRLRGSRCKDCGVTVFPARQFCPGCRREPAKIAVVDLPTDGEVHTFTVVRQAPRGIETPYVLARIELADGTRLMSTVVCVEPEVVEIGSKVSLVPAIVTRGETRLGGYAFTLKEETR